MTFPSMIIINCKDITLTIEQNVLVPDLVLPQGADNRFEKTQNSSVNLILMF